MRFKPDTTVPAVRRGLRARLQAGDTLLGCWLAMASPIAGEIIGRAGFDFAMIDNEHGPATLSENRQMIPALEAAGTGVLMRVPSHDPAYVKRVLDLGIEGIMFPSVSSASAGAAAVAACHYPPRGVRGYGMGLARIGGYGFDKADYLDSIAERLLVVCQIETPEGVDAIPTLAALGGIDVLFIGPYDLSASLGRLGDFTHPDFIALYNRAERAIGESGIVYGGIPFPARSLEALIAADARFLITAGDVGLLREAARGRLEAGRAAVRQKQAGACTAGSVEGTT